MKNMKKKLSLKVLMEKCGILIKIYQIQVFFKQKILPNKFNKKWMIFKKKKCGHYLNLFNIKK